MGLNNHPSKLSKRELRFRERTGMPGASGLLIPDLHISRKRRLRAPVPFRGWPQLEPRNPDDYPGIVYYADKHLGDSYQGHNVGCNPMVHSLMINLFLRTPGAFCKPGELNRDERRVTEEQVKEFSRGIRGLEFRLGETGSIGTFGKKKDVRFHNAMEFLSSDYSGGNAGDAYDYVSVIGPEGLVPANGNMREAFLEGISNKFDMNIAVHLAVIEQYFNARAVKKELRERRLDQPGPDADLWKRIIKTRHDRLTYEDICAARERLPSSDRMLSDYFRVLQMIKESLKKREEAISAVSTRFSGNETIVDVLARNVAPNGVLLLSSKEYRYPPGFRKVTESGSLVAYQRFRSQA